MLPKPSSNVTEDALATTCSDTPPAGNPAVGSRANCRWSLEGGKVNGTSKWTSTCVEPPGGRSTVTESPVGSSIGVAPASPSDKVSSSASVPASVSEPRLRRVTVASAASPMTAGVGTSNEASVAETFSLWAASIPPGESSKMPLK